MTSSLVGSEMCIRDSPLPQTVASSTFGTPNTNTSAQGPAPMEVDALISKGHKGKKGYKGKDKGYAKGQAPTINV
eukprot:8198692-Prorocentrum_lima.AAC.1